MGTLADAAFDEPVKLLLMGESGSGKTGSLASLANAGYELAIQDYDNGTRILASTVKPEFHKNVFRTVLTDKLKTTAGGQVIPDGYPKAFATGSKMLNNWVDGETNLGSIASWKRNRIYVLDSLTMQGRSIIRLSRARNGDLEQSSHMTPTEWGAAMEIQEKQLEMLFSDAIQCHVIVVAHIIWSGGMEDFKSAVMQIGMSTKTQKDGGAMIQAPPIEIDPERGLPSALGKKLPPKVGQYFNTTLMATVKGSRKHVIQTVSDSRIRLKTPIPGVLPPDLPIETGLATVFEKITGGSTPSEV